MGLLAPLFLAGLLAVAIPIVVHLVHRERKEPLAFPSLMFLRRVPFRSARRQRIRYWLLFLLRATALILIAAAFARPWIDRPQGSAARSGDATDVVVLVDRSYSMSAAQVWQRARAAAERVVAEAGSGHRVAVIAFGEQAELLARLDEPRAHARTAVQGIEPGSEVTRYAPAFKLAGSQLSRSRGPAEIVLITDRQRSGWRNIEQVPVPPNSAVRVVDVSAGTSDNVAVTDVQLAKSMFAGRQRIVPRARVVNRGDRDLMVPLGLYINERKQQSRTIEVKAHSSAPVSFDAMFAASVVGEVRIESADDLAADNHAWFTTESSGIPTVRLVSGNADAGFYFEQALTAANDGSFNVQKGTRLAATELAGTSVVVLLEGAWPTGEAARQLQDYVRRGGGLILAGVPVRSEELAPVSDVDAVSRAQNPAALVSIDALHPVFEPFRATAASQFSTARMTHILRGRPAVDAQVIARFDDGTPALLEKRVGRGRVLYWASGFTRAAGDLVLQPAFVPFVQQLVRHASASTQAQPTLTVGSVIDVNNFAPIDREAVVFTPSGKRIRLAAREGARSLRIGEAGLYQIRGTGEGAATQLVAANVDIAESDLTPINSDVFNDAITARTNNAAALPAVLQPRDHEQNQNIWWYLLLIAFVFLAGETFWGNRISTAWRSEVKHG